MKDEKEFEAALKRIPQFVVRDLAVKNDKNEWNYNERMKAVTEEHDTEVIAAVTKRYKLVQFEEVYKPAAEKFDKFTFGLTYYFGKGYLHLLPKGEDIGICVKNSVDGSTTIQVNFEVYVDYSGTTYRIAIPSGKFKKVHSVQALPDTVEYLKVITTVKQLWKAIVDTLQKNDAKIDDVELISKRLRFGERRTKELQNYLEQTTLDKNKAPTIWELMTKALSIVAGKEYKSEWHKDERLSWITDVIEEYAVLYSLSI